NHPLLFLSLLPRPPTSPLFPYTTLFRSYLNETAADELAKVMPLGLLGVVLVTNQLATLRESIDNLARLGDHVALIGVYFVLVVRSEEHTSELQSRGHLVCRLLLEKKK